PIGDASEINAPPATQHRAFVQGVRGSGARADVGEILRLLRMDRLNPRVSRTKRVDAVLGHAVLREVPSEPEVERQLGIDGPVILEPETDVRLSPAARVRRIEAVNLEGPDGLRPAAGNRGERRQVPGAGVIPDREQRGDVRWHRAQGGVERAVWIVT